MEENSKDTMDSKQDKHRCRTNLSLVKRIRRRQAAKILRREGLEKFITTGKLDGRRGRGDREYK